MVLSISKTSLSTASLQYEKYEIIIAIAEFYGVKSGQ